MTNTQIILTAMQMNGVTEPVDTFAGWNRRGQKVKKGSKALFTTSIWKPVYQKNKEDDSEGPMDHLILVKAAFFGASQVEPAGEEAQPV